MKTCSRRARRIRGMASDQQEHPRRWSRVFGGAAYRNRTDDLFITSESLWPTELRRHGPEGRDEYTQETGRTPNRRSQPVPVMPNALYSARLASRETLSGSVGR